jgi:catechol 2,3-dioxygenase-like lactoylglutathione lyase family enzyme
MLRIGSIVIHCHAFDRMVAFWEEALHYAARTPTDTDWVVLRDPNGVRPSLSFQRRAEPPRARSWLHLDLYADDASAEVTRLLSLGASLYPWRYEPGADYVVLTDPDGHLFCVIQEMQSTREANHA